jgi:hypothetical protein
MPTYLLDLDSTRLSNQLCEADLQALQVYDLLLGFTRRIWPDARVFGFGVLIPGGVYLPPQGSARNHSYVEYDGLRYGSCLHSSGRRAQYGYIRGRQPVRVERIIAVEVPGHPHMHTICVLVRLFKRPRIVPDFPWSAWCVLSI